MKITMQVLAALVAAHASHAGLITSMAAGSSDKEPATEGEINAAIAKADNEALVAENATLRKQAADADAAHKAALAAKDKDLAALQARFDALSKLGAGAPDAVGGDTGSAALSGLNGEALWKAEFERSAETQEHFGGDLKAYLAHRKHEAATTKNTKKEG